MRDREPDLLRMLEFLSDIAYVADAMDALDASDQRDDDGDETHAEWHQKKVKTWEDKQADLSARFGEPIAADLVELQRISARVCGHGAKGLAVLVGATAELMDMADGDKQLMVLVGAKFVGLIKEVRDAQEEHKERKAEATQATQATAAVREMLADVLAKAKRRRRKDETEQS